MCVREMYEKYMRNISEIYQKYIRNISEIYQKYIRNISEIYFLKGPDLPVDTYSGNQIFHFFSLTLLSAKCDKLYHPGRAKLNNESIKTKDTLFYEI